MESIKTFLEIGYGKGYPRIRGDYGDGSGEGSGGGYGDGSGSGWGDSSGEGTGSGGGYGSGSGSGDGSGWGDGDGSGSGDGWGSGSGSGWGDSEGRGIRRFNGQDVHYIDEIPTILNRVHGNLAKGFILNGDLTLRKCCVAKGNNLFAHGDTRQEAVDALRDKIFANMDTDEKINAFIAEIDPDTKYPARFFYDWHHKLTGSCEMGRDQFARDHGIDIESDAFTVAEFIELTEDAYGGLVIRDLKERLQHDH